MSTTNTRAGASRNASPAHLDRVVHPKRASNPVSQADVRVRAYQIYLARRQSGGAGDATSDWLQAESELRAVARGAGGVEVKSRARGERAPASGGQ